MAEMKSSSTLLYGLGLTVFGVVQIAQNGLRFSHLAVSILGALMFAWGAYNWVTGRAGLRLSIGVPLSIIGFSAALMLWVQFSVGEFFTETWLVFGLMLLAVVLVSYPRSRRSVPTKD